jgi:hypothetical protein
MSEVQRFMSDRPAVRVTLGLLVAAVGSVLGNVLVAQVTLAAGASEEFEALMFGTFAPLTVIGVLLGAAGWAFFRRRPATLRWLVPTVVVVSWVPDILVGAGGTEPGVSWTGVAGLMVMHVVVTAVTVPILARVLPTLEWTDR